MTDNIIEINNLSCSVRGKRLLENVSLSVPRASITGIIGPNGAGKTTLVKCALRLMPYEGEVRLDGLDSREYDRRRLALAAAYFPSEIHSLYDYTVSEILEMADFPRSDFWGRLPARPRPSADRYASAAGVAHLVHRKINSLSSGERQMVYLAQALAQESKIIILDEPTSHLDIGRQITFFETLLRLNRENGLTVLFVNHDINVSAYYATKIAIMKDGGIFCAGAPQEVINEENLKAVYGEGENAKVAVTGGLNSRPVVYLETNRRNFPSE